jgi:hypothetical protein
MQRLTLSMRYAASVTASGSGQPMTAAWLSRVCIPLTRGPSAGCVVGRSRSGVSENAQVI